MRTLLHVYPTFKLGGAQMRFIQLANHFGGAYRHVIVAMDGQIEAFSRLAPGLKVEMRSVPVHRGRTWTNLKTFRAVLKTVQPDLLITSNWGSNPGTLLDSI